MSALAIPVTRGELAASFEVDLMGTVRLATAALPHLEASEPGAIVAISSVSGREIDFTAGPYGVMKAAIVHYVQGLAYQLAAKGVRANTVSPGQHVLRGRRLAADRAGQPRPVRAALGAQPDRPDGDAGGDGAGGGVPRQPGLQLHHGHATWSSTAR